MGPRATMTLEDGGFMHGWVFGHVVWGKVSWQGSGGWQQVQGGGGAEGLAIRRHLGTSCQGLAVAV